MSGIPLYVRARNWTTGSDPGLLRLRMACRTTAALAITAATLLVALLDGWPLTVAYVCDPNLDVVLANSLACKISPYFKVGANPIRALFLEPDMRDFLGLGDIDRLGGSLHARASRQKSKSCPGQVDRRTEGRKPTVSGTLGPGRRRRTTC